MSPEERKNHCYLGDRAYSETTPSEVILRTGSHKDEDCDNKIYLDDSVIENFERFLTHIANMAAKNE